jgi:hypothetical protein
MCSAYLLNTTRAKTRQVALWDTPLSAEIPTPPEQLSLRNTPPPKSSRTGSLIWSHCQPEPPLEEILLRRGAPAVYFHRAVANCSAGNPPRGNPGLKRTRTDTILKKVDKINIQQFRMNFRSIQKRHL